MRKYGMQCLSDGDLQAVADGEAGLGPRAHVNVCAACQARLAGRLAMLEALMKMHETHTPSTGNRIRRALSTQVAGSTTLAGGSRPAWQRWSSRAAVAAAIIVAIWFVAPRVAGPGELSAQDVIDQSLLTLTEIPEGVEYLDYSLTLEGVSAEALSSKEDGTYMVEQIVDHTQPGRYLIANRTPERVLMSSISQDPKKGIRTRTLRIDGQNYFYNFKMDPQLKVTFPELERTQMESTVAMLRASSNRQLRVIQADGKKYYEIKSPPIAGRTQTKIMDLQEARILVSAGDFRIREYESRGVLLGQPYHVAYRLVNRQVKPAREVPASAFELPRNADDIVLEAKATENLLLDTMVPVFRELKSLKSSRSMTAPLTSSGSGR